MIVIKILLALILLGFVLAVVGGLLYMQQRRTRRAEGAKQHAVHIEMKNPDAAWLYSQGLSPQEIELAAARRSAIELR